MRAAVRYGRLHYERDATVDCVSYNSLLIDVPVVDIVLRTNKTDAIILYQSHRMACMILVVAVVRFCHKLFKGSFYYCQGPDVRDVYNKTDCINKPSPPYKWIRHKYNFDDLGQVRCSL